MTGRHKACVAKVIPQLTTEAVEIIIKMGVQLEQNLQHKKYMPLIGEVRLRFDQPTSAETI